MLCGVPDGARCDRRNGIAPGHYVVEGSSGREGSANRICRFEWIVPRLGNRPSDLIASACDIGARHRVGCSCGQRPIKRSLELHDIDPPPENRMDPKDVATKSISRIVTDQHPNTIPNETGKAP